MSCHMFLSGPFCFRHRIAAPCFIFDMVDWYGQAPLSINAFEDICKSMTVQLDNSTKGERGIINAFMQKTQCMTRPMIDSVAKYTSTHTRRRTSTTAQTHLPTTLPPTLQLDRRLSVSPLRRSLSIDPCGLIDKHFCTPHRAMGILILQ